MTAGGTVVHGRVVTPGAVIEDGAVVVEDGRIAAVLGGREAARALAEASVVIGGAGMLVLPGAVDAHVHAFSEPAETFTAATSAAAAGGVTTILDMPYDAGSPVNTAAAVVAKRERLEREAVVDVALHGTVRPGDGARDVAGMIDEGVCGFKVSLFETDPIRFPRIPSDQLLEAFAIMAERGVRVGVHAEDGEIIGALVAAARAAGRTAPLDHVRSRPPVSETSSVALGLELASAAGVPFHIFHASLPGTVELVTASAARGLDATLETCPHYLVLTEDDMERLGALGKINPPLRTAEHARGMWEALADGRIGLVTSDHAPWPLAKKSADVIFDNASGAPGVQTLLPIVIGAGYLGGRLSLLRAAEVLATNPARAFGLGHRKGAIEMGLDADFAVVDPSGTTVIDDTPMLSTATWSPYAGMSFPGRLETTVVRGTPVFSRAEGLLAEPGDGRFVARAA
ncbi:dihydroorotase family protein [Rathayibacter sp. VKM Ac-2805]|uniref:dihydroorotase n=1 Tax=Rathayibacter sp. VKM Ac-2805 TaxID=2609258 RepID=UPI00131FBCA8|nr:dihydroorotase family protein [Rathayibacter sp. VKM Ac-2805]QHC74671.1 amidohydrolase family protein [Rathayibacter sp. VKM Ac-2805]